MLQNDFITTLLDIPNAVIDNVINSTKKLIPKVSSTVN